MEHVNAPVAKLARRRGLPTCDVTDTGQWVPTHSVCLVSDDIRAYLDVDGAAAWLSEACDPSALGPIYARLSRSSSVGMLLNDYRGLYQRFRNYAELDLVRNGQHIDVLRRADASSAPHSEFLDLYHLLELVRIIQRLTGVSWTPTAIRLQHHDSELARRLSEFANAEVRVGAPATGLAVPIRLLGLPIRKSNAIPPNGSPDAEPPMGTVPLTLSDCTYALICSRFVDGYPEMASIAECMGISARTLQRQLAHEGLTYRDLVERYRFEAAKRLIDEGKFSLIRIACQLGYTEAASFTRAFRRWAGLSPSEYRAARALQPNTVA
jgi:AraC-like DNA-binding protein